MRRFRRLGPGQQLLDPFEFLLQGEDRPLRLGRRIEHLRQSIAQLFPSRPLRGGFLRRELDQQLIMSSEFVARLQEPMFEIGHFALRGIPQMQLLFGLPPAP